jgi:hypothetical protein
MAYTKTSIANEALGEIGKGLIVSLTENSEPARLINAWFDDSLDEETARYDWTFATYRAELPPLAETPAFGWAYKFQLPSNPYCLRVIEEVDGNDYRIEGREILADTNRLRIRYIGRVTDLNRLSPNFVRAFSLRIASKLAVPLVGSRELRETIDGKYREAVASAESMDAGQEPVGEQEQGSWLDARGGV